MSNLISDAIDLIGAEQLTIIGQNAERRVRAGEGLDVVTARTWAMIGDALTTGDVRGVRQPPFAEMATRASIVMQLARAGSDVTLDFLKQASIAAVQAAEFAAMSVQGEA